VSTTRAFFRKRDCSRCRGFHLATFFYKTFNVAPAFTSSELRTFFCGNSRPGVATAFTNGNGPIAETGEGTGKIIDDWQNTELHFETSDAAGGWITWDFTSPVIVTKVDWTYTISNNSRSGGVAVTGSSGGYGLIGSGAVQNRVADWGDDCVDCPKVDCGDAASVCYC
jgi:hypothetical protein